MKVTIRTIVALLLVFPLSWICVNGSYSQMKISLAQQAEANTLPSDTIYMLAYNGNIYTIDSSTGLATLVGTTLNTIEDIAFDGSSLYGVSFTALYSIDTTTFTATQIGNGGFDNIKALAVAPDGTLWAISVDGSVYTIDKSTGIATAVGNVGSPFYFVQDLAFSPDGSTLYAVIYDSPNSYLATINLQTGSATLYNNPIGYINVDGITFKDGVLYGADKGDFFSISLSTGQGTEIRGTGINVAGLSTSPSTGGLWQGASPTGNGWVFLSWFGAFSTASAPWIYHQTLGWLYPVGSSTNDVWFYDPQWDGQGGWWWTSASDFPWVYSVTEQSWLYYDASVSAPYAFGRWFAPPGGQWATH